MNAETTAPAETQALDATAAAAADLKPLFVEEAKRRQREHGGTAPGQPKNTSGTNTGSEGEAREQAAQAPAAAAQAAPPVPMPQLEKEARERRARKPQSVPEQVPEQKRESREQAAAQAAPLQRGGALHEETRHETPELLQH